MNGLPYHLSMSGRAVVLGDGTGGGVMVGRCYTKRDARNLRDLLNAVYVLANVENPHLVGSYARPGVVPVELREQALWLQIGRVRRQAVAAAAHLGIENPHG